MALTDQVLMPGSDYQAICDNVRNLEGISEENKLTSGEIVNIIGSTPLRTSADLTVSGATVSVPPGHYNKTATKSVATATQATPSISVSSSGLITSVALQSAGYVSSGTKSTTEQLPTVDAADIAAGIGLSLDSVTGNSAKIYITSSTDEIANSYIQESPDATSFGYVTVPTETKTVGLSMADGDQTITNTDGKFMTSVTVQKPWTLIPSNVRKDVNIGGTTGILEEKHYLYIFDKTLGSGSFSNTTYSHLFYSGGILYSSIIVNIVGIKISIKYTNASITTTAFSSGSWVDDTFRNVAFIGEPTGTLLSFLNNFAQYQDYDAAVDVYSSHTITANGTYSFIAKPPYDGLAGVGVTVNVPASSTGVDLPFTKIKTLTIDDGVISFTSSTFYQTLIASRTTAVTGTKTILTAIASGTGTGYALTVSSGTDLSGTAYTVTKSGTTYTYTWTIASSSGSVWYDGQFEIYGFSAG